MNITHTGKLIGSGTPGGIRDSEPNRMPHLNAGICVSCRKYPMPPEGSMEADG